MATMHAFVRQQHGDMDPLETVIYGPSTSNQVKNMYFIIKSFYKYWQLLKHKFWNKNDPFESTHGLIGQNIWQFCEI